MMILGDAWIRRWGGGILSQMYICVHKNHQSCVTHTEDRLYNLLQKGSTAAKYRNGLFITVHCDHR